MSTTYIGAQLRRQVVARARRRCEYCLIHEDDTFFGCHVDHIVSEKHGGSSEAGNLAYAYTFCNLHKGSDIASLSSSGVLARFFNPRVEAWSEHFSLSGAVIESLTEVGEVTAKILRLNDSDRILERRELIAVGRYPSASE